jgi:pyruvate formate-lyase activating enzyme-like uncharacterized protein
MNKYKVLYNFKNKGNVTRYFTNIRTANNYFMKKLLNNKVDEVRLYTKNKDSVYRNLYIWTLTKQG